MLIFNSLPYYLNFKARHCEGESLWFVVCVSEWDGFVLTLSDVCVQRPPPVLDTLGRVISEAPPDQWEAR